ncbi:acyl-CoA dehydrogenase [Sphingobium sp. SCG-1]|uniref:acyl-CoA dehydrogenase family protein n=1 Tax=Sphingobium sp. SCG-1 TaxID=2072936 RepID=UPI000CD67ABC|nr:acyl-CoA dehydrogenase family protein [Sphingobium sp. SCG-1]AUW57136.1 acyl-CoA dehydrogenase [Sphingobium sp. SCG-1]
MVEAILTNDVSVADQTRLPDLLKKAAGAVSVFVAAVTLDLKGGSGCFSRERLDAEQHVVHGFAWYATYAAILHQTAEWAARLSDAGEFTPTDKALVQLLFVEYAAQLRAGISMTQNEVIRPFQLTRRAETLALLDHPALVELARQSGNQELLSEVGAYLVEARARATLETDGLDETMAMVREQFFAFSRDKVAPYAHDWHLADKLIPIELVEELSAMGVFGMTVPEEFGGLGMGKIAMCVVSEELSRGWIGVGSLGTRSEIAAELILTGGTDEQRAHFLPKISSGEILPTAVFTEPDTGSDLGSLRTHATQDGDHYVVNGNKTWITHGARADLMTLLVRTHSESKDYRGLSMFLASKQRGTDDDPFPSEGMSGGEIEVIGYRGMKEYEIGFENFSVPAANLLGGVEGQGFKHLMATFESARIQTAARAIGVGQAALDVALSYALERKQFGRPIFEFPRVQNKLAMVAAELLGARQLTYHAAWKKDQGKRCDLEAGMAKLLGARVAWSAADNGLQIHGGNGFAMEYRISRLLADARILNIFEGAGEIQAHVIARRLLDA